MRSTYLYVSLALIIGACMPTQAGINHQLRQWVGSPVLAAVVSFCVGTSFLIAYSLVMHIPLPLIKNLDGCPWWIWTGGIVGAVFVTSAIIVAPKLGAASLVALVVTGQMVTSILLDHFGLLGYEIHPITPLRVLGIAMVVGGVALVR
jgi:bacterial/archaeal transporter family-2 protein